MLSANTTESAREMVFEQTGDLRPAGFGVRRLQILAVLFCIAGASFALPVPKHLEPSISFQALVDAPESDVLKAVQQVIEDQVVHGTYSYEKEKTLTGAHSADSSAMLDPAEPPAKTLYKVADNIIAPRHFKNTGDIGTITIRYVVRGVSAEKTNLQITALFYDARHVVHWSQGEVEAQEYAVIQQHLGELRSMRLAASEAAERNQEAREAQPEAPSLPVPDQAQSPPPAQETVAAASAHAEAEANPAGLPGAEQELEREVATLRRQAERRVKAKDTPLKSAPFRGATTLQKLPAQSEVVILIVTPYWYGVEAENGQRGWVHHSQLEPLP
jgi:hypothetical protein